MRIAVVRIVAMTIHTIDRFCRVAAVGRSQQISQPGIQRKALARWQGQAVFRLSMATHTGRIGGRGIRKGRCWVEEPDGEQAQDNRTETNWPDRIRS